MNDVIVVRLFLGADAVLMRMVVARMIGGLVMVMQDHIEMAVIDLDFDLMPIVEPCGEKGTRRRYTRQCKRIRYEQCDRDEAGAGSKACRTLHEQVRVRSR